LLPGRVAHNAQKQGTKRKAGKHYEAGEGVPADLARTTPTRAHRKGKQEKIPSIRSDESTMTSQTRYAVYFAPDQGSELESICSTILGRDARTGNILKQVDLPGIEPSRLAELTASPRHYGLHGTLKPPFFLAEGMAEADFLASTALLASGMKAFELPPLRLATIGSFLALTPSNPCLELENLARVCVTELDRFRRPPSPGELARRRAGGLTPNQDRLLEQWGYPYVLDEFRFHLTLTGSIPDPEERHRIYLSLAPLLEPFAHQPLPAAAISIFRQPHPDEAFTLMQDFPLA
jgi:putative phosphonate metabolism protein